MSVEQALIDARPPAPRGLNLDQRSLDVQDVIARTRVEAHPISKDDSDPERGYLPRHSTLRMIYEEQPLVSPIAHIASFVLGMTDANNAIPTIEYMRRRGRSVGRNADTALAFKTVITGSREEADPVINSVFLGHAQVHREAMKRTKGPHPERAAHDPFNPERGIWTVGVLGWGAKEVHGALVRPFTDAEDQTFREVDLPIFGGLFGSEAPSDPHDLVRQRVAGGDLHLTEAARTVAMQNWYQLTVPRWLLPLRKYGMRMVLGLLPEEVRDMYEMSYGPQQEKEFDQAVSFLSEVNSLLRRTRPTRKHADEWLFKLTKREEARLQRRHRAAEIPDPYASLA